MNAVYKKEIGAYFHTMHGYLFITGLLFCSGLLFSSYNIIGQNTDLKPVWYGFVYVMLILSPVLTMRLLAAEHSGQTDVFLMTSPVSSWSITIAKYFAAVSVFGIALCLSLLYPFLFCFLGTPSFAQILTGYLGVLLFGCLVISIGLFVSSLMKRPLSAGLSAFGIMLFIMLINSVLPWISNDLIKTLILRIAPLSNAAYFLNGFISIPSIIYFLTMTVLFLFLTARSLEHTKWSKGRQP